MKKGASFAVIFMFLITAFCSALLISLSKGTSGRVEANQQLAFEKAVLAVFPEITYQTDQEAHRIFKEHFEKSPQAEGVYVYRRDGAVAGYALTVSGKGFWAPISGIVGIAPDGRTMTGIAFYDQSETPGLGARIIEPEFTRQFEGLVLGPPSQPVDMRPPGTPLSEGQVHAISGATQTCVRLEKIINEDVSAWLKTMGREEVQP